MKVERSHREDQERFYSKRSLNSVKDMLKKYQRYMNRDNNVNRKILNFLNLNQVVEEYFTEAI